jgi:hypothetical protein
VVSRLHLLLALVAIQPGCARTVPAPEGLDDSTRFLLREFYGDDATISAGLSGFLDWYDEEGNSLVDVEASADNAEGFEVAPLEPADLAALPIPDDGRELLRAQGVIGLARTDCAWDAAEALLVRADQAVVFDGEWSHYERAFVSDRGAFEAASAAVAEGGDGFAPVGSRVDTPSGGEALDASLEPAFLLTENAVGTDEAGVVLDYTLHIQLRHGRFDVQGEETPVLLLLTWLPERADGEGGTNSIEQVYGVDVLLEREPGHALRLVASWTDVRSPWLSEDDPSLLISTSVRRIQRFADRLTEICREEVELPLESGA